MPGHLPSWPSNLPHLSLLRPPAQFVPSESFFPSNGTTDMFFDMGPFNATFVDDFCRAQFGEGGPVPGFDVLPLRWGARPADFATASNIIFSNGLLDPWSSGAWVDARLHARRGSPRVQSSLGLKGKLLRCAPTRRRVPDQHQRLPGGRGYARGGSPRGPVLAGAGW